jgi:HAMP domain-containing protein
MKLTHTFALLMIIPLAGLGFVYWAASESIRELSRFHVRQQARLLMDAAIATRKYTEKNIQPKLQRESKVDQPDGTTRLVFNKETVPAFAASETLKNIYEKSDNRFKDYEYKEASDNPTDMDDQASNKNGRDESGLLHLLKTKEEHEDEITINQKPFYFFARRIIATENDGCMKCHGSPAAAPPSMIDAYMLNEAVKKNEGGGFHWKDKDVAAAQIVYVPRTEVDNLASGAIRRILYVLIPVAILTFASFLTGVWLLVIRPVARLSQMADRISKGTFSTTVLPVYGKNEIAQLTAAFNRMNQSLYKLYKTYIKKG